MAYFFMISSDYFNGLEKKKGNNIFVTSLIHCFQSDKMADARQKLFSFVYLYYIYYRLFCLHNLIIHSLSWLTYFILQVKSLSTLTIVAARCKQQSRDPGLTAVDSWAEDWGRTCVAVFMHVFYIQKVFPVICCFHW